ncbi:MAG: hypothetical protein K2Q20_07715, partial [Phycisphaerales bacterium]|nr:hypothetical protein [Phycisphaerales bacterium]
SELGGGSGGPGGMGGGGAGAGGGESGEWEEWPDRYVFDILVPATRLEALCRSMLSLLPGRVYPIVDYLGQDEWREVDPYVSYDLVGVDRFLETLRRFAGFFFEDGLVGFGAMSEEPFVYVFVDEHKVVTVRVEAGLKERVEAVLAAFDLESREELLSADSATHEHRTVLEAPDGRRDLLNPDEIMEGLRDEWHLVLNIDPESNVDEEGNDLGVTGWRCIVRYDPPLEKVAAEDAEGGKSSLGAEGDVGGASAGRSPPWPEARYCQVFLTADSYNAASDLAYEGLEQLLAKEGKSLESLEDAEEMSVKEGEGGEPLPEPVVIQADRWGEADFTREVESVTGQKPEMGQSAVSFVEWLQ